MTLCTIFPIHLNFPISSRCFFKAIIHRKKNSGLFYGYLRMFFFFKKTLFMILCKCMWYLINFSISSHSVPIFHVSLSIIDLFFAYLEEHFVFLIKRKVA